MNIEVKYKLNKIMSDRNISFRQLEIMSGLSFSYLNKVANNQKNLSVINLCRIAIILNVNLNDLIEYHVI